MSSPTASAPTPAITPANPRSRVITASLIGTTIEFYDFYVYATAAVLVFPILFFPTGNETTALLASFGVFGAAMVRLLCMFRSDNARAPGWMQLQRSGLAGAVT